MCQTRCSYQDHNGDCIYARGITPCVIDQGLDQVRYLLKIGERAEAKQVLKDVKADKENMILKETVYGKGY